MDRLWDEHMPPKPVIITCAKYAANVILRKDKTNIELAICTTRICSVCHLSLNEKLNIKGTLQHGQELK